MRNVVAAVAVGVVLLLALFVTPVVSPQQDAPIYLAAAQGYLAHGLASQYAREPLYPLFLAALERGGVPLTGALAVVQNALFLAGLWFFVRPLLGPRRSAAATWTAAALITLVPTFLVTVNGAMYTESLSCTAIFVMLGSLVRLLGAGGGGRGARRPALAAAAGWTVAAMLASAALALLKGAFLYVNVAFGIAGALAAALVRAPRARRAALAGALLGVAAAAWGGTAAWLSSRTPPLAGFDRRGWILFGRAEYAGRFDFAVQTVPYLLNALSESACWWAYGAECASYTFEAENAYGLAESARVGGDDTAVFRNGLRTLAKHPVRETLFAGFELTRFVLHHGTTGFARARARALDLVLASEATALGLKLFNLALYLVPLFVVWRVRSQRGSPAAIWRAWPGEVRLAVALAGLYSCVYLAVYGFATTAVRMVYPIAPLVVVFDALLIGAALELRRSAGPAS